VFLYSGEFVRALAIHSDDVTCPSIFRNLDFGANDFIDPKRFSNRGYENVRAGRQKYQAMPLLPMSFQQSSANGMHILRKPVQAKPFGMSRHGLQATTTQKVPNKCLLQAIVGNQLGKVTSQTKGHLRESPVLAVVPTVCEQVGEKRILRSQCSI